MLSDGGSHLSRSSSFHSEVGVDTEVRLPTMPTLSAVPPARPSRKHSASTSVSLAGSATKRSKLSHPDGLPAPRRPEPVEPDVGDESCFSNFSAIPLADTAVARLNQSPSKLAVSIRHDRSVGDRQALSIRARNGALADGSPTRPGPGSNLHAYLHRQRNPAAPTATPARSNLLNLLDFEMPPAPTPKSVPTISVRELETVKSEYLSQISALKASLSGREAEVGALKTAVADAERRVGEAHEIVREERSAREHATKERLAWEQRHLDAKNVLDQIKKEVIRADDEREDLVRQLDDARRQADDAWARAHDAETRTGDSTSRPNATPAVSSSSEGPHYTAHQVQDQIDAKIQILSTELHAIYKKKHLAKVAGLKKGFDEKTKRLTSDFRSQIDALSTQVNTLEQQQLMRTSRSADDAAAVHALYADLQKRFETQKAELETQRASVAGLEEEVRSVLATNRALLDDLENERVEKGELVSAVEEMLALQATNVPVPAGPELSSPLDASPTTLTPSLGGLADELVGNPDSTSRPIEASL